jgi:putative FmdB family regulatory protein
MPTYEYRCEKCGETFEAFQSMKDAPLETCPKEGCGGKVKRLIGTGAGLIFKGSGFYITDYRSSNYKEAAKKDSGSTGSTGTAGSTGSSAAKSEPKNTKPASSGS